MYLTREQSLQALAGMKKFNDKLRTLFSDFDMNLEANLGRRNILLSGAQEKFFADSLKTQFPKTQCDGGTGEPDIVIPELNKELECKLTTRYQSTGALAFQSDSMAFEGQPNGLDFLYVIADEMFESFAVLHFVGLKREDFHEESTGARGRVRMKKHMGIPKCNILVGSVEDIREKRIGKYEKMLDETFQKRRIRFLELTQRINKSRPGTKAAEKAQAILERENNRFLRKIGKIEGLLCKWHIKNPMYSILPEKIGDEKCQNLTCAA